MNGNLFKETRKPSSKNSFVTKFVLTSDKYDVTVYYAGDYDADKKDGMIDCSYFSAFVKPKDETVLSITVTGCDVRIDDPDLKWIRADEADIRCERLTHTIPYAKELQRRLAILAENN